MSPVVISSDDLEALEFACPDCGKGKLRRLARTGFLQKKVLAMLGFYPWECPICRRTRYYRKRGRRQSRRAGTDQAAD